MTRNMVTIIVSKDEKIRKQMARLIEGHEIIECDSFIDAIACLSRNQMQCETMFADYKLGLFTGLDLLECVKNMNSQIYTVLLINRADTEAEIEALGREIDLIIDSEKPDVVNRAYIERLLANGKLSTMVSIEMSKLVIGDVSVALTRRELALVGMLINRAGNFVSREEIVSRIWRDEIDINQRRVDVHIRAIRLKLANNGLPDYIVTGRNAGYRWETS